ncbi:unnamed protein product [Vitrella brassicaformis CCMP3155]|uniref:C2 domain-containing protein n=2 Tax=Vitrella brassicaformis TaxID=1169539 RepID=A0A0G4H472_VITBC|nr:unnamed protein product [Vitrella brassicaformis CCMP3155]|eukprot:CEM38550.1 unnamed protein product [Vitrella brassicaformis CCMP3155]
MAAFSLSSIGEHPTLVVNLLQARRLKHAGLHAVEVEVDGHCIRTDYIGGDEEPTFNKMIKFKRFTKDTFVRFTIFHKRALVVDKRAAEAHFGLANLLVDNTLKGRYRGAIMLEHKDRFAGELLVDMYVMNPAAAAGAASGRPPLVPHPRQARAAKPPAAASAAEIAKREKEQRQDTKPAAAVAAVVVESAPLIDVSAPAGPCRGIDEDLIKMEDTITSHEHVPVVPAIYTTAPAAAGAAGGAEASPGQPAQGWGVASAPSSPAGLRAITTQQETQLTAQPEKTSVGSRCESQPAPTVMPYFSLQPTIRPQPAPPLPPPAHMQMVVPYGPFPSMQQGGAQQFRLLLQQPVVPFQRISRSQSPPGRSFSKAEGGASERATDPFADLVNDMRGTLATDGEGEGARGRKPYYGREGSAPLDVEARRQRREQMLREQQEQERLQAELMGGVRDYIGMGTSPNLKDHFKDRRAS